MLLRSKNRRREITNLAVPLKCSVICPSTNKSHRRRHRAHDFLIKIARRRGRVILWPLSRILFSYLHNNMCFSKTLQITYGYIRVEIRRTPLLSLDIFYARLNVFEFRRNYILVRAKKLHYSLTKRARIVFQLHIF